MVACQTDLNEVNVAGGEVDVTFEVGAPAARAYSDGATATVLQYAVYEGENELTAQLLPSLTVTDGEINISTTVKMQLVTGNTYTVIFWAAAEDAPYRVDFANKTMTVNYTGAVSNDENRDAFFKKHTFTVTGAQTETIELKRPFAQLNIGTSDYTASTNAGYTPDQSYVKVTNIYNTLNLWSGAVSNEVAAEFAYADIKKDETFPVAGYEYLAMNYLLVNEKETVDVEFAYKETRTNDAKTRTVGSVPVQRNYRTNIYGQLLTSDVDINVIIAPEYNEPAHELDALHKAALNGGEVTLTEDVVLTTPLEVVGKMTINLNGKTISGELHKSVGPIIKNSGTLTIIGGTISSLAKNGGSAIANYGNLTVENVVINGAEREGDSWPAYPINNYGDATLTNAVISGHQGCVALNAAGTTVLNNCEVTKNYMNTSSHVFYVNHADAKVVVNGGTYNHNGFDGSLAYVNKGEVTINGGTFNAKDGGYGFAALSAGKVIINGGNINAGLLNWGGKFVVKGGIFSSQPNVNYLAAGYKAVNKDGKYYVVANDVTVADTPDEVKNVFANGGTILLSDNIEFEKITSIEPGVEVHMNLNGKTVTVDQNTTSNTLIYVKDGAKLVIDGNGTIDLGAVSTMAVFAPYGELVIENGTFVRDEVTTVTSKTTGLFMGAKTTASNVTINGGYFDAGYYNTDAANVDEILAGTMTLVETADDVAKRGASSDKNKVRVAIKENVSALLNHSGFGEFKVYGGTFVGANPAWGDEGCMLPTTPSYLRPWSYYQGALLAGQEYNENGLVLPNGYTITKAVLEDGRPAYTVNYSK